MCNKIQLNDNRVKKALGMFLPFTENQVLF